MRTDRAQQWAAMQDEHAARWRHGLDEDDMQRVYALGERLAAVFKDANTPWIVREEDAMRYMARYLIAHCDEFSINNMLTNQPKP